MLDTNVSLRTIVGQRLFRDRTILLNGTEWYPHPHPTYQLLIGFGRIPKPVLGTSGGTPPVPPVATPLPTTGTYSSFGPQNQTWQA